MSLFLGVSAQRAQRFPDFAIDARGILRGFIDQLHPAAAVGIEFGVTEKIAALQDCLQRVAKVMRQRPQLHDVLIGRTRLCIAIRGLTARCRLGGLPRRRSHTISLCEAEV